MSKKIIREKDCLICGVRFQKKQKNLTRWASQKYCSNKCRFIGMKGHETSIKTREKISIANSGKKRTEKERSRLASFYKNIVSPHLWFGDKATYQRIHIKMYREYGDSKICEDCGKIGRNNYEIQWANMSGQYRNDRDDWKRLCASCHRQYDINLFKSKQQLCNTQ